MLFTASKTADVKNKFGFYEMLKSRRCRGVVGIVGAIEAEQKHDYYYGIDIARKGAIAVTFSVAVDEQQNYKQQLEYFVLSHSLSSYKYICGLGIFVTVKCIKAGFVSIIDYGGTI